MWIKVEDHLPGDGQYVVFYNSRGYTGQAICNYLLSVWILNEEVEVTHWRELESDPI